MGSSANFIHRGSWVIVVVKRVASANHDAYSELLTLLCSACLRPNKKSNRRHGSHFPVEGAAVTATADNGEKQPVTTSEKLDCRITHSLAEINKVRYLNTIL
jgi:hypothetical protein